MEIGIDIEQNERFKDVSQKFLERAFTKNEIAYASKFKNSHENFCALWCVKEAVVKAFSNRAIAFQDIEVSNTEEGRPFIVLNDTIKNELKKANAKEIKISISHSKEFSTAICIIN